MPSVEQVREWATDVERIYPETLADRLEWFVREFNLDPRRVLSLMGLPSGRVEELASPSRRAGVDWDAIAAQHEERAWWVEERLSQLLAFFHYDRQTLARQLRQPFPTEFRITLPGGEATAAADLSPEERDRILLRLIVEGGAAASTALAVYFQSEPSSACP
jgi:hypothetical protein